MWSSQIQANKGKFVTAVSEEVRWSVGRGCPSVAEKQRSCCSAVGSHCSKGHQAPGGSSEEHYKSITDTNCFHLCMWLRPRSPSKVHNSSLPSGSQAPGRPHLMGAGRQLAEEEGPSLGRWWLYGWWAMTCTPLKEVFYLESPRSYIIPSCN